MDELARPRRLVVEPFRALVLPVALLLLLSCGGQSTSPTTPTPARTDGQSEYPGSPGMPNPMSGMPAVLAGAGDIALCGASLVNAAATSKLLDGIGGAVFTAGDNTQAAGTSEEFLNCFDPTWGRHRATMFPALGNHDYQTANGFAYFTYFGTIATGPHGLGYYSYPLGNWHIIVLNSNLSMKAGSPQGDWLKADLQASSASCTAAYWHHPLYSSGPNGGTAAVRDAWTVLYQYGADVVMNGHDHLFERFAPQDPSGRLDLSRGIRQFTVGTGGAPLSTVQRLQANSEAQVSAYGVLKLTLHDSLYDWQFVGVPGTRVSDAGSGACH